MRIYFDQAEILQNTSLIDSSDFELNGLDNRLMQLILLSSLRFVIKTYGLCWCDQRPHLEVSLNLYVIKP